MRRTHRFELGEYAYEMTQLPLREARDMRMRLVRTLGPALAQIVAGGDSGLSNRAAGAAIKQLTETLDPKDVDWAFDKFLQCTQVIAAQGEKEYSLPLDDPETVEHHFGGDRLYYGDELLAEGLRLNFQQYFLSMGRSLNIAERFKAAMASMSPSTSPAASTGTSGDSSAASDSPAPSAKSRSAGPSRTRSLRI